MPNNRNQLRNSAFRVAALLIAATSLSGCVSLLLGNNLPPRFVLKPVAYETPESSLPIRLVIEDPASVAAFDSVGMAYSKDGQSFSYFTGGEWADRAPRLLAVVLERTFQNAAVVRNVGDRTTVPIGDYVLITDMRAFHFGLQDESLSVHIEIFARLTTGRGESIGTRNFVVTQAVGENSLSVGVTQFNNSLQSILADIVAWTDQAIEKDLSAPKPQAK